MRQTWESLAAVQVRPKLYLGGDMMNICEELVCVSREGKQCAHEVGVGSCSHSGCAAGPQNHVSAGIGCQRHARSGNVIVSSYIILRL